VRRERDFQALRRFGTSLPRSECVVRRVENARLGARLAIAAPRAYGNAVRRNRFRRLVREAFRRLRPRLGDVDLLVSPRKTLREPTLEGLLRDLSGLGVARRAGEDAGR
jgi:ribonuclease P protein component